MKKGFTLVELLAIIVLLGIIIVVAIPSLNESNRKANNNKTKEFNEIINTACISYIEINKSKLGDKTEIDVKTLIDEGFLKDNLVNPKTNKKILEENKKIKIDTKDKKTTCIYQE